MSSFFKLRPHVENQLPRVPGGDLKFVGLVISCQPQLIFKLRMRCWQIYIYFVVPVIMDKSANRDLSDPAMADWSLLNSWNLFKLLRLNVLFSTPTLDPSSNQGLSLSSPVRSSWQQAVCLTLLGNLWWLLQCKGMDKIFSLNSISFPLSNKEWYWFTYCKFDLLDVAKDHQSILVIESFHSRNLLQLCNLQAFQTSFMTDSEGGNIYFLIQGDIFHKWNCCMWGSTLPLGPIFNL